MIDLQYIKSYFPAALRDNPNYAKHIVKEYIQLMVLDYLSTTPYIRKLCFIGGTNLRLVKGIDRWSEDLDFDCRDLSDEEFREMTDDVAQFLIRSGFNVEIRDKANSRLVAYRRNIYFPQLLFDLNLTGHKDERFLLKIEAQDQEVPYQPVLVDVKRCGFFFPLPVPPDGVLLAMKLTALLKRGKGRDFYDVMFLMSQVEPDYDFLTERAGISDKEQLKRCIREMLARVDLNVKKRDFEHLLFNQSNSNRILRFGEYIESF